MKHSPRIAITGTGAVCGAGLTIDAIWDAILNGRSCIAPLTQWDPLVPENKRAALHEYSHEKGHPPRGN